MPALLTDVLQQDWTPVLIVGAFMALLAVGRLR